MTRYVMTAARKRALRKAQLVSARKRAGRGIRKAGRAAYNQRYAAGILLAGVAVSSGVYAAHNISNKRAVQRRRVEVTNSIEARKKRNALSGGRSPGRPAYVEIKVVPETRKTMVVDPKRVRGKIKVVTSSKNTTVLAIMAELQGQPSLLNPKRKYAVFRSSEVEP